MYEELICAKSSLPPLGLLRSQYEGGSERKLSNNQPLPQY